MIGKQPYECVTYVYNTQHKQQQHNHSFTKWNMCLILSAIRLVGWLVLLRLASSSVFLLYFHKKSITRSYKLSFSDAKVGCKATTTTKKLFSWRLEWNYIKNVDCR